MKSLFIVHHAKSEAGKNKEDFQRVLTSNGHDETKNILPRNLHILNQEF